MRRNLLVALLLFSFSASAQDIQPKPSPTKPPHKKSHSRFSLGIGGEYMNPIYGVSLKLGLNDHSAFQIVFNPSTVGDYNGNFYYVRYLQKFPILEHSNVYLFGGIGNMSWTGTTINFIAPQPESDQSFIYSVGGGYELAFGRFRLSGEIGLGNFQILGNETVTNVIFGAGLHFNIIQPKKIKHHSQGTTHASSMPPEDDKEEDTDSAPKDKRKPVKKGDGDKDY